MSCVCLLESPPGCVLSRWQAKSWNRSSRHHCKEMTNWRMKWVPALLIRLSEWRAPMRSRKAPVLEGPRGQRAFARCVVESSSARKPSRKQMRVENVAVPLGEPQNVLGWTRELLHPDFVAGATLSQAQLQILWQAQHFCKLNCRFRGRRNTFASSIADFVAGATLSQAQLQISWRAQHFRGVKYRLRGRRSTFVRSGADR